MKVSEATGPALDWMVAKVIGEYKPVAVPTYSTDWAQGGPIIERELIETLRGGAYQDKFWKARRNSVEAYGPTPLIAACRCYVASKLGEEVEVPEGL